MLIHLDTMSRTSKYKALYFGSVGAGVVLCLWLVLSLHWKTTGLVALGTMLLLPGRVLGFFWRDLLRGLRLLNARRFAESKRCSQRFLADIRARPWLKRLIWLGSGTYSRDPEALALNNLGAAEIMLGEWDQAQEHLRASLAVDSLNPLPCFNLGKLSAALGDQRAASHWFDQTVALGYSQTLVDRAIMLVQARFANTDGRGTPDRLSP